MRSEAWRPAAAARNRSPREARDPALPDPAQMPVREARSRSPKPPRWSAERRASRVMGRKAPRKRLTRRVMACPTGAAAPERLSALRPPSIRVGEAKMHQSARESGAERKGIVQSGVIRKALALDASCADLIRASIVFVKSACEGRMDCRVKPGNDGERGRPPHHVTPRHSASKRRVDALKAPLLSMRARERGAFWRTSPRRSCAADPSEAPTCGCRKRAPTRAPCFRPVLYRELRNSNVYTGIARTNRQPA
jgi:hypothetical protein